MSHLILDQVTQQHLDVLVGRGVHVIPPVSKRLACGDEGMCTWIMCPPYGLHAHLTHLYAHFTPFMIALLSLHAHLIGTPRNTSPEVKFMHDLHVVGVGAMGPVQDIALVVETLASDYERQAREAEAAGKPSSQA